MLPRDDEIKWLFDVYRWLLQSTGGMSAFRSTELVVLDRVQGAVAGLKGPELAEATFRLVKELAGMQEWPCTLSMTPDTRYGKLDALGLLVGPDHSFEPPHFSGTFERRENQGKVIITYNESLLGNGPALVAVFAHELSHYLLDSFEHVPPGGEETLECATDVGAVFIGFGIFCANMACKFKQLQAGYWNWWSHGGYGYIGQVGFSYALAVFTYLKDLWPDDVTRHLDPNPNADFREAFKDINSRWHDRIKELLSIHAAS